MSPEPAHPVAPAGPRVRTLIVTGLSGAGKTTALHALEDLGFYCVDNLPLPLLPRFVELCAAAEQVPRAALVVDSRGGEFLDGHGDVLGALRQAGHEVRVLYLEASDEVMVRRYSETRRRHPLGIADLRAALAREREVLRGLREEADAVVDTSGLTVHELKRIVQDAFGRVERALALSVVSFGYRFGLPAEADLVLDVRLLRNPYFVPELRDLPGTDPRIDEFVFADPEAVELLERTEGLLDFVVPRYRQEGKVYLTIAVGCTGGQHRSVAVAERLARRTRDGCKVSVRHRDLGRRW